jgi:hypothetical protein
VLLAVVTDEAGIPASVNWQTVPVVMQSSRSPLTGAVANPAIVLLVVAPAVHVVVAVPAALDWAYVPAPEPLVATAGAVWVPVKVLAPNVALPPLPAFAKTNASVATLVVLSPAVCVVAVVPLGRADAALRLAAATAVAAFRLATSVVLATTNGAVPVATVDVIAPFACTVVAATDPGVVAPIDVGLIAEPLANTTDPDPVSSETVPASCAEVVAENCDSGEVVTPQLGQLKAVVPSSGADVVTLPPLPGLGVGIFSTPRSDKVAGPESPIVVKD